MESVYLETTVIGYLAMRPSKDLLVAGKQQITHDWWTNHRARYELVVSQAVLDECKAGDASAVAERMQFLQGIRVLHADPNALHLADDLLRFAGLPAKADIDALHIAMAAINKAKYLLTWNCRHIANLAFRDKISLALRRHGVQSPVLCTPQELIYV